MLSVNGKHTHECHSEQQRLCWSEMDFSGKPLLFLCMSVSHFRENKRRAHTANTHPGLMAVVPFSGGRVSPWGDYSFCCSCACVNIRGLIYTRGRCRKVNKTWTRQTFFVSKSEKKQEWMMRCWRSSNSMWLLHSHTPYHWLLGNRTAVSLSLLISSSNCIDVWRRT